MAISRPGITKIGAVLLVVLVAAILRIVHFPARDEVRHMDEMGYCQGGLALLEGMTPGYKAAPAGPLFWLVWAKAGAQAAIDVIHPPATEPQVAAPLRPFVALNRVLFDNYRDLGSIHRLIVITNFALALFGAAGAAALGIYYGGIGAGILVGGLFAVVPVFLQLSEMSRPYSMAWSFGMLSLCCAAICASRWRVWLAGAFLGLAIASRIEMLCLLPLVWWIVCERRENSRRIVALVNVMLVSLAVAILVAPWLLTHLIGNLRTIATVRLLGPPGGKAPWASALWEIVFRQGMGIAMVLALAGLVLQPAGARRRAWLLTIYAALLLGSLLVGDSFGVHQHGEVFIALFLLISVTFGAAGTKWNRASPWIVAVALMLPFAQAVRLIRSVRAATVEHEDVPRWIEQHVPAGTTVYLMPGGMRSLLPTTQASDALWKEVTDEQAWRAKMASGLSRFHLSAGDLPRALADENLVQERGNRRQWFILGSRTDLPDPRYDIRVVRGSPVFGIRDPAVAMKQSGGVLVFRDGNDLPRPEEFGPPLVSWLNRDGGGVLIYCTPDLREKIKSDP